MVPHPQRSSSPLPEKTPTIAAATAQPGVNPYRRLKSVAGQGAQIRSTDGFRLKLDSDFYQPYEIKYESSKFRATWHHSAAVLGAVVGAAPWRAAAGRSGSAGSTAATLRPPL